MKVYGRSDSSNAAKVYWLLDELNQPYEQHDCGGKFGGNDQPWYRVLNPSGKVPTIDDDGIVVWESNAILRYLAARSGHGPLRPEGAAGRAAIDTWVDWCATALVPSLLKVRKARDEAGATAAFDAAGSNFALLDARLTQANWIAGDHFTIADIAAGGAVYRWFRLDRQKPALPALSAYLDRLNARPAFQRRIVQAIT
jgi:glutathione S-transferase